MEDNLKLDILKKYFNYDSYKPNQLKAINAVYVLLSYFIDLYLNLVRLFYQVLLTYNIIVDFSLADAQRESFCSVFQFRRAARAASRSSETDGAQVIPRGCLCTGGADRDDWISPNMISEHNFN